MTCLGSSRFGSLSVVGRIAQNAVQAAVKSFDDVAELVVCEEKGTQVDLDVGRFLSEADGTLVCLPEGGSADGGVE